MDTSQTWASLAALGILLPLLGAVLGLLILYLIIRHGVSAGLRDHQKWMERNRPQGLIPPAGNSFR